MKRGFSSIMAIALAAVVFVSCDKDDEDDKNFNHNQTDTRFLVRAAIGNTAEIGAGEIASGKADSQAIAEYGEMMVADHTTAQAELKALANELRLSAPDSLDPAHEALKDSLMMLTGREFDSVYIHSQVRDHEQTIALFQDEVINGSHHRIRNYAQSKLPALQMHLQHAQTLAAAY